jgi:hypothetical protein
MKYSDIRTNIKSGDLLAFSHAGWKSWHDIKVQAVRIFTKSEYSHVGIAWVTGGRVFCLEAVVPLVRIFPLSKLGDFYHVPMEINWTPDIEEYAMSIIGEKYSQIQAIESFLDLDIDDNLWECARYVQAVYEKAGIDISVSATPSNLVKFVQQELDKPVYLIENSNVD